eukprot:NODE_1709_length_1087_cov_72.785164_g1394_i0.p2 GENE.NODE_1709_length_1087_cov_72.785164_g1394_i0~~NODE_1709_length_1087_cov_72.785164_g1394_i0.p2  ORF type:complete len:334 (-),score=163.91 NODE_1709_length_1087_cov_72.785164_g1394_i0:85-1065(-)
MGELTLLNRKLEPVVGLCRNAILPPKKAVKLSQNHFSVISQQLEQERVSIMERKKVLEDRREAQEIQEEAQAREKETVEVKMMEELKSTEVTRMQQEAEQREAQRRKAAEVKEVEEQSRALFTEIVQQKGATQLKKVVKVDESIIKDQDRLIDEAKKQLLRAKEDRDRRLKEESKKMDYFARACRKEEIPLLKKLWDQRQQKDQASQQAGFKETLKEHRAHWEHCVEEKKRLSRMNPYLQTFRDELVAQRKANNDDDEDDGEWQEKRGKKKSAKDEEKPKPPQKKQEKEAEDPNWGKDNQESAPKPATKGYVPPNQRKAYVPPGKK